MIKETYWTYKKVKQSEWAIFICDYCGKEDKRLKSLIKGKYTYCNMDCRDKHTKEINRYVKKVNPPKEVGSRRVYSNGYVSIVISKDDPYYKMSQNGLISEHRYIMAKKLRRCLESWEVIHHKGDKYPIDSIENKSDNRLENLELVLKKEHTIQLHHAKAEFERKQKEFEEMKKELSELKQKLVLVAG